MGKLKENLQAIKAEKDKITPSILPSNITLFGIQGSIETVTGSGNYKPMSGESEMKLGEGPNPTAYRFISPGVSDSLLLKDNAAIGFEIENSVIAQNIELTPEKIIQGQTILGIQGTAQPYVDPTTTQDYQDCLVLTNEILGVTE